MILPLPRTGHGHRDCAHRLGLVHFAVAEERPHLAIRLRHDAAVLEIPLEAGLVDRHHRPQAHRYGRELPEVRHQPGMRIRRQAVRALHFPAEVAQVVFGQAPFHEGARIYAGGRMPLDKHHVAGVIRGWRAPEMIETHLIQGGGRSVGGDVPPQFGALAIRLHDHRGGIPANVSLELAFDGTVARVGLFLANADRIDVRGVRLEREVATGAARVVRQPFKEEMGPFGTMGLQHRVD
jgi:hypothetical protein